MPKSERRMADWRLDAQTHTVMQNGAEIKAHLGEAPAAEPAPSDALQQARRFAPPQLVHFPGKDLSRDKRTQHSLNAHGRVFAPHLLALRPVTTAGDEDARTAAILKRQPSAQMATPALS